VVQQLCPDVSNNTPSDICCHNGAKATKHNHYSYRATLVCRQANFLHEFRLNHPRRAARPMSAGLGLSLEFFLISDSVIALVRS
jgi:hypothetical protein